MKRFKTSVLILVNVLMLLACCNLYSQNFVTESKRVIVDYFDSLQMQYTIDFTTDGFQYLHFIDGLITVQYYFNERDTCIAYKMLFPDQGFAQSVDALNRSFKRIRESMWQEYDGQQYFIWSLDKSVTGYTISVFSKLSLDAMKLE